MKKHNFGDRVVNNVSTPKDLIPLFDEVGADVLGILCYLNRSEVHESFNMGDGRIFPIVPIVRQPTKQWRQDDPEVSGLITAGQIVWKPKIEWEKIAPFVR